MLRLVEAGEAFSLRVNEGELGRELLEDLDGGGLIVDEDAALAGGKNFAAKNDFGAFCVDSISFENGFCAGGGFEDAGERGFVGAVADQLSRAFAS